MRKKLITALTLIASATTSTTIAQDWSFGAKVGVNMTNTSGSGMDPKVGYAFGGIAKYNLNDDFALKGEIVCSGQGTRDELLESGVIVDTKILLNYLNIPIMASYNFIGGLSAGIGVQPGLLLSAKVKASADKVSVKEDIMGECNNVDFSIPMEICYDFRNGIHLGVRYAFGVSNVVRESYDASRNQVLNVSAGYMF